MYNWILLGTDQRMLEIWENITPEKALFYTIRAYISLAFQDFLKRI